MWVAPVLSPDVTPVWDLLDEYVLNNSQADLTRDISFPVAIAFTDSKQPVVEKVQQLPQWP